MKSCQEIFKLPHLLGYLYHMMRIQYRKAAFTAESISDEYPHKQNIQKLVLITTVIFYAPKLYFSFKHLYQIAPCPLCVKLRTKLILFENPKAVDYFCHSVQSSVPITSVCKQYDLIRIMLLHLSVWLDSICGPYLHIL